jgi:hypothetical protein
LPFCAMPCIAIIKNAKQKFIRVRLAVIGLVECLVC